MSVCVRASWKTQQLAMLARRRMESRFRVRLSCALCERCDCYHVNVVERSSPLGKRWRTILVLLAHGFSARHIGPLIGLSQRYTENEIAQMMRYFYALNRTNLVAIAISLGIVNPQEFVPPVTEGNHP